MAYKVNCSPVCIHCVTHEVEVVRVVVSEEGNPRCKHGDNPRSPSSRSVEAADLHRLGRRLDHSRNDHRSNRRVRRTVVTEGIVANNMKRGEVDAFPKAQSKM